MSENPELTSRSRLASQYDLQIFENDKEIKLLANKIIRSDYEQKQMEKLREKQRILLEKQRQHQQYLRGQEQLERMAATRLDQDRQFKRNMNEDYRTELERKHATIAQQDRKRIEDERDITRLAHEQMEQDAIKQKYFHQLYRRRAISDVQYKQRLKQLKKQEAEKEKALYRRRYEDSMLQVNPKSTSYKQFFDHFTEKQKKAEMNYKATVMPKNVEKEISKEQLVNRGVYDVSIKSQQAYVDSVNQSVHVHRCVTQAKKDLRQFLKRQIDEKDLRRSQQKEQVHIQGIKQLEALQHIANHERNRLQNAKDDTKFPPHHEQRTLVAAYHNRRASESQLGANQKIHNPITNPIDFKFGYTNPYIVREFEQAKREAVGDGHLRLGNLALLGSSSLMK